MTRPRTGTRGFPAIRTETKTIRIGYVPLTDSAPLLVAEELGYFEQAGLRVQLSSELGWGSVRDKIAYGELDAAHALGGLLFSVLCGTHSRPRAVATDLVLNLQGNAITLSRQLWQKGVRDGKTLRLMIRSERPRKPVFAVVSTFSSHLILLRQWLASAGINPDTDVRLAVLPPPLVAEHMREGQIDGFCVGEPWSSAAALSGEGWVISTSTSIAPHHPEKILLATEELMESERYPALRKAIVNACRWCDNAANREALVDLLRERAMPDLDRAVIANALVGPFQTGADQPPLTQPMFAFHRNDANTATHQRASWFLEGLVEAGSFHPDSAKRRACLLAFREPAEPDAD